MQNFFKLQCLVYHVVGFLKLSVFANGCFPNIYYFMK